MEYVTRVLTEVNTGTLESFLMHLGIQVLEIQDGDR